MERQTCLHLICPFMYNQHCSFLALLCSRSHLLAGPNAPACILLLYHARTTFFCCLLKSTRSGITVTLHQSAGGRFKAAAGREQQGVGGPKTRTVCVAAEVKGDMAAGWQPVLLHLHVHPRSVKKSSWLTRLAAVSCSCKTAAGRATSWWALSRGPWRGCGCTG